MKFFFYKNGFGKKRCKIARSFISSIDIDYRFDINPIINKLIIHMDVFLIINT